MIEAKKNSAYYLSFPAIDSATPASYKSGISPVDTAYYKDGAGAWSSLAITDTATEIGATGVYEIDLTASEMNHDKVIIKFAVSGMADDAYQFDMRTKLTDDLNDAITAPTAVENRTEMDSNSTQLTSIVEDTNELQTDDVPGLIATAQSDLDKLTGADGATLATTQGNYEPATAASLATTDGKIDTINTNAARLTAARAQAIDDWINGGRLDLILDIIAADVVNLEGKLDTVDTVVDGIQADLSNGTDGLGALKDLIDALNDLSAANVNAEMVDVITVDAISEIAQGVPSSTPNLADAVMLLYMALRNKVDVPTSGTDTLEIHNDAGTRICQKLLTDDGSDYSEAKMTSGA